MYVPFMAKPIPLLLLSDAPTSGTGLGRITNDLATRIAEHMADTFRVATVGYGGVVSRHLPYHQYILEEHKDFVCLSLPEIWEDWAGNEKGIVMSIWDLSRLGWLAQPKTQCENIRLMNFLLEKPFELWGYLPIDAEGPNGKLTYPLKQALLGFNRFLAYGEWAANIIDRTLDQCEGITPYLPHGINSSVFYERNRKMCRKMFVSFTQSMTVLGNMAERVDPDDVLIGIVATNNARKDWQLGIETVAILAKTHRIRLWIKTDIDERSWSIPALLIDYGLLDRAMITYGDMKDDDMARAYSACDLTLGIGPEGFGYPIHESIFCGTPCIHGYYAGAPEWMDQTGLLVDPIAYRYESNYSHRRPVFSAQSWASRAESVIGLRMNHNGKIDWNNLWSLWENWLKEGVK